MLDGTVGLGGHARAIAPRLAPAGAYIGLDADEAMIAVAAKRTADISDVRIRLERASYADLDEVLDRLGQPQVDHVLLDLGVNSAQLEDPARGFSFDRDGPLDMRYDRSQKLTAADLVNGLTERELSDLLYEHGEETLSRKVARRICEIRRDARITTTRALSAAVASAFAAAGKGEDRKTNPATRVFQALRIVVNRELNNLDRFLARVTGRINTGGVLAIIAFHSLEDGAVKRFFRDARAAGTFQPLTATPLTPDEVERRDNPRSRSAKLRAGRRIQS